jgi:hypothetical protein
MQTGHCTCRRLIDQITSLFPEFDSRAQLLYGTTFCMARQTRLHGAEFALKEPWNELGSMLNDSYSTRTCNSQDRKWKTELIVLLSHQDISASQLGSPSPTQ